MSAFLQGQFLDITLRVGTFDIGSHWMAFDTGSGIMAFGDDSASAIARLKEAMDLAMETILDNSDNGLRSLKSFLDNREIRYDVYDLIETFHAPVSIEMPHPYPEPRLNVTVDPKAKFLVPS